MGAGRYFRSVEESDEERIFLWLARSEPGAIQHWARHHAESAASWAGEKLPGISLRGSGWQGVPKRLHGEHLCRGGREQGGAEVDLNPILCDEAAKDGHPQVVSRQEV